LEECEVETLLGLTKSTSTSDYNSALSSPASVASTLSLDETSEAKASWNDVDSLMSPPHSSVTYLEPDVCMGDDDVSSEVLSSRGYSPFAYFADESSVSESGGSVWTRENTPVATGDGQAGYHTPSRSSSFSTDFPMEQTDTNKGYEKWDEVDAYVPTPRFLSAASSFASLNSDPLSLTYYKDHMEETTPPYVETPRYITPTSSYATIGSSGPYDFSNGSEDHLIPPTLSASSSFAFMLAERIAAIDGRASDNDRASSATSRTISTSSSLATLETERTVKLEETSSTGGSDAEIDSDSSVNSDTGGETVMEESSQSEEEAEDAEAEEAEYLSEAETPRAAYFTDSPGPLLDDEESPDSSSPIHTPRVFSRMHHRPLGFERSHDLLCGPMIDATRAGDDANESVLSAFATGYDEELVFSDADEMSDSTQPTILHSKQIFGDSPEEISSDGADFDPTAL
jgi:hypothetical protein